MSTHRIRIVVSVVCILRSQYRKRGAIIVELTRAEKLARDRTWTKQCIPGRKEDETGFHDISKDGIVFFFFFFSQNVPKDHQIAKTSFEK